VKEAMFSAVQFEIAGRAAMDAFAGSGQLGIEALSRGAASCLFLEQDAKAAGVIEKNLARCRAMEKSRLLQADAMRYMRRTEERFGLIFLDPPYGTGLLEEAIPLAAALLEPGGLLLCEAPAGDSLPTRAGDVALRRSYRHGKTKIDVYQKGIAST
jgi:16S rRNA (guanine(966)-N(2))-methyltransferase RsmD